MERSIEVVDGYLEGQVMMTLQIPGVFHLVGRSPWLGDELTGVRLPGIDHHEPDAVPVSVMEGLQLWCGALGDRAGPGPEHHQDRERPKCGALEPTTVDGDEMECRNPIPRPEVVVTVLHVLHDHAGGEGLESVSLTGRR